MSAYLAYEMEVYEAEYEASYEELQWVRGQVIDCLDRVCESPEMHQRAVQLAFNWDYNSYDPDGCCGIDSFVDAIRARARATC